MKKIILSWSVLLLCSILTLTGCSTPEVGDRSTSVIPAPIQLVKGENVCKLEKGIVISFSDKTLKQQAQDLADFIQDFAGITASVNASPTEQAAGKIHLLKNSDRSFALNIPKAYGLSINGSNPADENYALTIDKKGVEIRSTASEGIFRGISSLKQLIGSNRTSKGETLYLPEVKITDGPRFAWRGLSLDVSRCFFDPNEVKQVIDLLALYKFNVLHMHLTDNQGWRIEIKKYPKLTEIGSQLPNGERKGGFYTQEEFKDLVAYAKARYITILPEVDLPGHTAAVFAAYPEFVNAVKLRSDQHIPGQAFFGLDVDDPKAMQFTKDVLEEIIALSPADYVHIGGDEAVGLPHDKFVRYINKVREFTLAHGKKMIGWQETARADIQEGDVFQHWIHIRKNKENALSSGKKISPEMQRIMNIFKEFMKDSPKDPALGISKKAKVILSPSGFVYMDHRYLEPSVDSTQKAEQERLGLSAYEKQTIREMYEWDPMTFNPTVEDATKDVAGIESAIWCETIQNMSDLQFLLLPRLVGVAEKGWSQVEKTNWEEYKVRLGDQAPIWDHIDWNYFKSSLVDWK